MSLFKDYLFDDFEDIFYSYFADYQTWIKLISRLKYLSSKCVR